MYSVVSKYLYLSYKLRLSLCVKVAETFQARVGCFIFNDIIFLLLFFADTGTWYLFIYFGCVGS